MSLYLIEYEVVAVVDAKDDDEAAIKAMSCFSDACGDSDPEILDIQPLTSLAQLSALNGWDGECFPYGAEAVKRIKEYLP